MFAANTKTGIMIALLALTCSGVLAQPAPDLPSPPPGREPRLPDKEDNNDANKPAEKIFDANLVAFPDGHSRDFGSLPRGTQAYHAFRIVNTSNLPLQIRSVRIT